MPLCKCQRMCAHLLTAQSRRAMNALMQSRIGSQAAISDTIGKAGAMPNSLDVAALLKAGADDRRRAIREAAAVAQREADKRGEPAVGVAIAKAILALIDD